MNDPWKQLKQDWIDAFHNEWFWIAVMELIVIAVLVTIR